MMTLSFWYPFFQFVQPGILWPELAPIYPIQILNALVFIFYLPKASGGPVTDAFKHPAFCWMIFFVLVVRSLSVLSSGIASVLSELFFHLPTVIYVVASLLLVSSKENLLRYTWGMMLGGLFIVGYGIYAFHTGMRDGQWLGMAGAYGVYENHNDYTIIIIQIFPFLYLCRKAGPGFLRSSVLYVAMAACLYGVAISRSRGGMIALVLEVVVMVFLTTTRKRQLIFIPMILLAGGAAISFQFAERASMSTQSGYTEEKSESSRYELWKAGKNMFFSHPILGVGSGRFGEFAKEYYDLGYDQLGKVAHNTYIQVAATTGIFGIIGFGAMLLVVLIELRVKMVGEDIASLDWIRAAALVCFFAILFRGYVASKDQDLCFYLLVVIATAIRMQRRRSKRQAVDAHTSGGATE